MTPEPAPSAAPAAQAAHDAQAGDRGGQAVGDRGHDRRVGVEAPRPPRPLLACLPRDRVVEDVLDEAESLHAAIDPYRPRRLSRGPATASRMPAACAIAKAMTTAELLRPLPRRARASTTPSECRARDAGVLRRAPRLDDPLPPDAPRAGAAFMADVQGRPQWQGAAVLATLARARQPPHRCGRRQHETTRRSSPSPRKRAPSASQGVAPVPRPARALPPAVKWNAELVRPGVVPEAVRKAFKVAQTEKPGPRTSTCPRTGGGEAPAGLVPLVPQQPFPTEAAGQQIERRRGSSRSARIRSSSPGMRGARTGPRGVATRRGARHPGGGRR